MTEDSFNSMTCRNCGTTENVGEDGLCGDCEEDEERQDEIDDSLDDDEEAEKT